MTVPPTFPPTEVAEMADRAKLTVSPRLKFVCPPGNPGDTTNTLESQPLTADSSKKAGSVADLAAARLRSVPPTNRPRPGVLSAHELDSAA